MPNPTHSSDIVETNASQAVFAGGIAALCLIVGTLFVYYRTLAIAGWVLIGIAAGCIVFVLVKMVQNKQLPVTRMACPYCQFQNSLTERPEKEFMCRSCGRMVPIESGVMLPIYRVNCEHCTKENFFSRRTIKLICEDCGKEINLDSFRVLLR